MTIGAFVLDCSVTMSWCFADEACPYADSVLYSLKQKKALVPPLWRIEVSNVLLFAQRKERIHEAGVIHFIHMLNQLPIEETNHYTSMNDIVLLGRLHQLTAYDICYLHLSISAGVPIATLDKRLREAALQAGGNLYEP